MSGGRARATLQRGARVTLAACVVFYVGRFLLNDRQLAVYAAFGVISLGALSTVAGTALQRLRLFGATIVVGGALVALGTWSAVNVWVASAGMFVVGFVVTFAAVGGPRLASITAGWLLMYILPSFPPYSPDALDSRLIGVTLGVVAMAAADRWIWPAAQPPAYEARLANAATSVAAYLQTMRPMVDGRPVDAEVLAAARERADSAQRDSAPFALAPAERPSSPSRLDRARTSCSILLRALTERAAEVERTLLATLGQPHRSAPLFDTICVAVQEAAESLSGRHAPPDGSELREANRQVADRRVARLREIVDEDTAIEARLRFGNDLAELGETGSQLVVAVRAVCGAPLATGEPVPSSFSPLWYLNGTNVQLWWRRLHAHLTPHSVLLQNALRLGVGLAVARYIAGRFELSHGFWVLLATLTLMRTTATATRSALRPALLGTVAGALVAAALLVAFGEELVLFAILLPFTLFGAFVAGPLLGPVAAQACFTVAVAALFMQVAPADWRLAEARLVDVIVGGLIGAVVGLVMWPRGGHGEMIRAAARTLGACAEHIRATVEFLVAAPSSRLAPTAVAGRRWLHLAGESLAQIQAEGRDGRSRDWQPFVVAAHRILLGGRVLRRRYPRPTPLPWPDMAALLDDLGASVAGEADAVARSLRGSATARRRAIDAREGEVCNWLLTTVSDCAPTADTLRVLDTRAWLLDVAADLGKVPTNR